MLELHGIRAGYDNIRVLHDVDMHVDEGEIVMFVGSNGAGETMTMRTICDILSPSHGEITYRDEAIRSKASYEAVKRSVVQVPKNRNLFTSMTVIGNLLLGAQTGEAKAHREKNLDRVLGLFPRLTERKNQRVGTMFDGEQQMSTPAHALMGEPDLFILDGPSVGLAPHLVQEVFDVIEGIHAQGMTVLMVEQNVQQMPKLADRGYVMKSGHISVTTDGDQLLEDEDVVETCPRV